MAKDRPNLVLLVADDHGRDGGCFGTSVPSTPCLDGLAADGVRFTQAFCTTASCAASRSVILTGLHNHTNGTYGHTHGCHHFACFDDVASLPVMLKRGGYRTGRVGKYHHAPEKVFAFDAVIPAAGRDDVRMSENCRAFIEADGPFFLYWCSLNPHRDGRVLESHPCRPDRFGNPDRDFPGDHEQFYDDAAIPLPDYLPDTPESRAEWAQYCQSVSRLDRGVGRLLQILTASGKIDSTLIVYISDNGPAFAGAKTTLYEPGMNLPCIMRAPGRTGRGTTCGGLVTWCDLTPTFLDAAGLYDGPAAFHGDSFLRLPGSEQPAHWREEVYAAHSFHEVTNYYPMRVVRTRRHKFIWNLAYGLTYSFASDLWASATWQGVLRRQAQRYGQRAVRDYLHRPRFELYDLQADPHETTNLAERPECAALVREFCGKLRAFQERTRDPWLHKWQYE
jgi:N-sulfoglucosamine sulfohydrolase